MKTYYMDSAVSYGMVYKWFTEFWWWCGNMNDTENPRCPNEVTIEEIVNKIHDIVLDNCQVKINKITKMINSSDVGFV